MLLPVKFDTHFLKMYERVCENVYERKVWDGVWRRPICFNDFSHLSMFFVYMREIVSRRVAVAR